MNEMRVLYKWRFLLIRVEAERLLLKIGAIIGIEINVRICSSTCSTIKVYAKDKVSKTSITKDSDLDLAWGLLEEMLRSEGWNDKCFRQENNNVQRPWDEREHGMFK